jgi:hypothetical protein
MPPTVVGLSFYTLYGVNVPRCWYKLKQIPLLFKGTCNYSLSCAVQHITQLHNDNKSLPWPTGTNQIRCQISLVAFY